MKRPKMIIFDAGRTLTDYTSMDTLKGVRKVMEHVISNPRGYTAEYVDGFTNSVFNHFEHVRKQHFEVHEQTVLRLVYDLLDIKLAVSMDEVERIIWSENASVEAVGDASKAISELNCMGIRTAVISNLNFSGYLLKEQLDVLFPDNRFEFVIASSDYGVRKPSKLIFEAGIMKSGLLPEEIWFVGDRVQVDVVGSRACGMVPILFKHPRNYYYDEIPADLPVIESHRHLIELVCECE